MQDIPCIISIEFPHTFRVKTASILFNFQETGSAAEAKGIRVGQIILKVNGTSTEGLGHLDCAKVIARAFKDKTRDHMELVVLDSEKDIRS